MIDVGSPFSPISRKIIHAWLTEDDFAPSFSVAKKFYYSFLRPILPVHLRQRLQEIYNKQIDFHQNFIDSSFVDLVLAAPEGLKIMKDLFPENRSCSIVLTHDVESEKGFRFVPEIIELELKYSFRSSWNIVPYKYKIDRGIITKIRESGHEIGIHGYNHDGKLYYSKKTFSERVPHINRALNEYGAVGFRSPMVHRNLRWLQDLDIAYDASCFDYDPFQPFPGGTRSIWPFIAGKFVELPYTLPQDHTLFHVLKQKDNSIWERKTDWIVRNHGVVLTLTHPDYLMEGDHLHRYELLLHHLAQIQGAWRCLPKEMAEWWILRHNTNNDSSLNERQR